VRKEEQAKPGDQVQKELQRDDCDHRSRNNQEYGEQNASDLNKIANHQGYSSLGQRQTSRRFHFLYGAYG
jgi:hypothetical protein